MSDLYEGKYAYSYDGHFFIGSEDDREEAHTSAITEYTFTGDVIYTGFVRGGQVVDIEAREVGKKTSGI